MDTKKVIVTILILTIILSVLTVAFTLTGGKGYFAEKRSSDQATVGFEIKDINAPVIQDNSNANVGLYVSS